MAELFDVKKYRIVQDRLFESDFDKVLKELEVKNKWWDHETH